MINLKWPNIFRKLLPRKNRKIYELEDLDIDDRTSYIGELEVSPGLEENITGIKQILGDSFDLNIRRFEVGRERFPGALVFMAGLSEPSEVNNILESVEIDYIKISEPADDRSDAYQQIVEQILKNKSIRESKRLGEILDNITQGSTAIFFQGVEKSILCETSGYAIRNIQEPLNEVSLRGPRDSFVENIFTNSSLIRRRIRVPHLWFQSLEIGSLSKTKTAFGYIKGLASEELVEEVKSRLERIDIDTVQGAGYIQEYLHDHWFTIFPLIDR